ncbi:hypothetical protein U1Q18_002859 [Sarracenia purpurea var. burkii]
MLTEIWAKKFSSFSLVLELSFRSFLIFGTSMWDLVSSLDVHSGFLASDTARCVGSSALDQKAGQRTFPIAKIGLYNIRLRFL